MGAVADRRAAVRMTESEVAAVLAEPGRTMTVATLLADGRPHLTAVWYGFTADGRLGFTTYAASQKARNLERDPRLTVLVEGGDAHAELYGVQISGRAVLSMSMALKLELSGSVAARYPAGAGRADPGRAMARRVAVLVDPLRVSSWDHRKLAERGERHE